MDIFPLPDSTGEVDISSLLNLGPFDHAGIDVGSASFPPGIRFPESGWSQHAQHEISIILNGGLMIELPGETIEAGAGQVIHLEPGEQHAATASAETQVFYVLYGEPVETA